jgi:NAD(P)-dependent dehydrogenase (short-subunit alcohol dehydrogenase family)
MPPNGQAILIVGGGQGIGLETTRSILSTSPTTTKIVVFGLHADSELAWISGEYPGRVWIILGDVTVAADRQRAVDTCLKELGSIDTLVYCAGVITPIERIEHVNIEAVKRTFDVNVFGAMAMVSSRYLLSQTGGSKNRG